MTHYVYRCYEADGGLLYVGCTQDVDRRLSEHRRVQFWAPRIARVEVVSYPSAVEALAAEKTAILTEQPRFNRQYYGVRRVTWSPAQWDDYIDATRYAHDIADWRLPRRLKLIGRQRAIWTGALTAAA